jgi:hypothetical protein
MPKKSKLEVVDASDLTDSDWAAINKVIRAFRAGGMHAFWQELDKLDDGDLVLQIKVAGAFFPNEVREALKNEMAEQGITIEDLQEVLKKLH